LLGLLSVLVQTVDLASLVSIDFYKVLFTRLAAVWVAHMAHLNRRFLNLSNGVTLFTLIKVEVVDSIVAFVVREVRTRTVAVVFKHVTKVF